MSDRKWWHHSHYEGSCWRWWLHGPKGDDVASVEVSWRSSLTGLWFQRSDGGKYSVSIGLYWVYATGGIRFPWVKRGDRRSLQLTFHDRAVWWNVWRNDDSWSSDVPYWRSGSFHPVDALFGRDVCTRITKEQRDVLVPMPEKAYPATAELVEFSWKRPGWPWARKMLRVSIEVPGGIPHSGKGENSWDCGDDATFGMTTGECRSIPEGVGQLVGSCLRDRVRYGGWDEWSWNREAA